MLGGHLHRTWDATLEHEDHDMMRPFVVRAGEVLPYMGRHGRDSEAMLGMNAGPTAT